MLHYINNVQRYKHSLHLFSITLQAQWHEMSVNHLWACRPASSYVCNAQLWSASQFVFIEATPELCKLVGNAEPAVNKLKHDHYVLNSRPVQGTTFWRRQPGLYQPELGARSTFNLEANVFTSVCVWPRRPRSDVCKQYSTLIEI